VAGIVVFVENYAQKAPVLCQFCMIYCIKISTWTQLFKCVGEVKTSILRITALTYYNIYIKPK
jgi:hypothetical protein